ncbi:hypothetical protein ACJMK2_031299, partial [Sinanodonta woodiana]
NAIKHTKDNFYLISAILPSWNQILEPIFAEKLSSKASKMILRLDTAKTEYDRVFK